MDEVLLKDRVHWYIMMYGTVYVVLFGVPVGVCGTVWCMVWYGTYSRPHSLQRYSNTPTFFPSISKNWLRMHFPTAYRFFE
jgi:hypothetical protein